MDNHNRLLIKKHWKMGRTDPEHFLYQFVRDKKGNPISLGRVPAQEELIKQYQSGKYRELYLGGGNSGGKTWCLALLAVWCAVWKYNPHKPIEDAKDFDHRPYGVLCTGAEQKHSNELWQEILNLFERSSYLRHLIQGVYQSGKLDHHPRIVLKNGAIIDSIGLHDKGKHVVTGDYSLILVNEIGEVKDLNYILTNVLTQRTWRQGGVILGAGTPRGGEQSEYWQVFRRGMPEFGDGLENAHYTPYVFSMFADSRDNPFADQVKISEFLETGNETVIEERVMGKFVGLEGAAFPMELLTKIFSKKMDKFRPTKKSSLIHGLDFGRKGDHTVCITLDTRVTPWKGVNLYRSGGGFGTWEGIFRDIKALSDTYGGEFWVDTTAAGGNVQAEWLRDIDIDFMPINFSPAMKGNLVSLLQRVIGKQQILLPDSWEVVKDELRIYPANFKEDAGMSTDSVFALALACHGATMGGGEGGEPPTYTP